MSEPDYVYEFADIVEKWNAIEERIKDAELICGEAVVPAINELRYAGRQFVDAMSIYVRGNLTQIDLDRINTHIKNVRYNLTNADHDCTDAVCLFFHEKLKGMLDNYDIVLINNYFPNAEEFLQRMDGANRIISGSRKDRHNRISDYKALAEMHIPRLKDFHSEMLTSEPLILAHQQSRKMRLYWLPLVVAVIAGVLTVVFYR